MTEPKYDMLAKLSDADKAQAIVGGAVDYTAIKHRVMQSASRKAAAKYAGAAVASKALLPATMAAEAVNNTRKGWGTTADQQLQVVGDDMGYALAEGLANPLTTLYNTGRAAASQVDQLAAPFVDEFTNLSRGDLKVDELSYSSSNKLGTLSSFV